MGVTWDASTDVLIVGFGVAGAAAALEAVAGGAEVLAVDRSSGGGASAISGGIFYAGGGTSVQRDAKVDDSPEEMLKYLQKEVGDAVSTETLRRFVDASPESIDWLIGHGVPFEASLCPYKTSYPNNKYYLYYSGSEAAGEFRAVAKPAPRGHRPKGKGTSGKKLYAPLAKSAKDKGVQLYQQTKASKLIVDDEGAVIGLECATLRDASVSVRRRHAILCALSDKPGVYSPPTRNILDRLIARIEKKHARTIRIQARHGVVLSAGGFVQNRKMLYTHAPDYKGGIPLGTSGDDGSGINLGVEVGAGTAKLDKVSAWRFIVPPSAFLGTLLVGPDGRRMVDESRYGAALGSAMVKQSGGAGWLLADADLVREAKSQIGSQAMWFQRVQTAGMMRTAVKGNTVAEVARKAGIDPVGLQATVDAHNAAAAAGEPDPMGKYSDFVRPAVAAPFTLYDVSVKPSMMNPCPMITLGGLVVDETTGAVQTPDGQDIRGLYSAGRTAVGVCSNSYVSGLSLADCVFSGRRAGAHIAALATATTGKA
ncbi:FAD-binding protein [Rhodococcus sp. NPDC058521]|uniref:FAD-binding protein n=1 Tax=Rhodococcus sp. NPDC058521 TaxID=3346536 RepID=UPI003664DB28